MREDSDLFSLISLYDDASRAVGTLSASRISSGTGDHFSIDTVCDEWCNTLFICFPGLF